MTFISSKLVLLFDFYGMVCLQLNVSLGWK